MPVLPIEVAEFGGLDLRDDPQEFQHTAAVDLMNVDFSPRQGRLAARNGYTLFAGLGATGYGLRAFTTTAAASNLLTVSAGGVKLFDTAGSTVFSSAITLTSRAGADFADVGSATDRFMCFSAPVNGGGSNNVYAVKNQSSLITVHSNGGALATTPWDGRLMIADYNTAGSSSILFSDPQDPTSLSVSRIVSLDPGDGELITSACSWNNLLFVFKQTKFYVFYSVTSLADGTPVFNYRPVRMGQGAAALGCAVPAPEGVYFVNPSGVWLTTGGPAAKISDELSPLFAGISLPYLGADLALIGQYVALGQCRLALADEKLHVLTAAGTLVFDRAQKKWTGYSFQAGAGAGFNSTYAVPVTDGAESLYFIQGSSVFASSRSVATDNGAAVSARYRTGFLTPAVFSSARTHRAYPWPGAEGVVREWLIDGQGTITVKSAFNDSPSLGTGAAVTLGVSPATSQGRDRRAIRGRNVSVELSGTGPWQISRLIANVQSSRGPGNEAAA